MGIKFDSRTVEMEYKVRYLQTIMGVERLLTCYSGMKLRGKDKGKPLEAKASGTFCWMYI